MKEEHNPTDIKTLVVEFDPAKLQKVANYITKESTSNLTYVEMSEIVNTFTEFVQGAVTNINTLREINGDPPKQV